MKTCSLHHLILILLMAIQLFFSASSSARATSNCNSGDEFAPCACKKIITAVRISENNKEVMVQFAESVCVEKENKRRIESGEIEANYFCFQVREEATVYRDLNDMPTEVNVKRRSGCELRCVKKKCGVGAK